MLNENNGAETAERFVSIEIMQKRLDDANRDLEIVNEKLKRKKKKLQQLEREAKILK